MQLNQTVPDFNLPDQAGRMHTLAALHGQIVILNFWSAECPWSERADRHLLELVDRYPGQVSLLPIASNINETAEMITRAVQFRGLNFVLLDSGCALADLYEAQNTPHAFVIDAAGCLRYRGAVDDVTFRKRVPERFYVQEAVQALLAGRAPEPAETLAYGCTIVRP